jgi:predicted nucleotide-binding protein
MAENIVAMDPSTHPGFVTVKELHAFLGQQIKNGYPDDNVVVVNEDDDEMYGNPKDENGATYIGYEYDEESELVKITFGVI